MAAVRCHYRAWTEEVFHSVNTRETVESGWQWGWQWDLRFSVIQVAVTSCSFFSCYHTRACQKADITITMIIFLAFDLCTTPHYIWADKASPARNDFHQSIKGILIFVNMLVLSHYFWAPTNTVVKTLSQFNIGDILFPFLILIIFFPNLKNNNYRLRLLEALNLSKI